jgi:uncharacterized protein (TIGR00369 family)
MPFSWSSFPPALLISRPTDTCFENPPLARTLRTVVDEPVRGYFPDPSLYSLAGIDQYRAYLRRIVPPAPLSHLIGFRLTDLASGAAVLTLPLSPWLQLGDGTVEVDLLVEIALHTAFVTTTPPGHEPVTSSLSVHHLRPCTLKSESLIARGRVLNTGPKFTVAEVLVEDALGRAVAHGGGSAVVHPIDPPPPPPPDPLEPVQEPVYPTPDPHLRPVPPDTVLPPDTVDQMGGWREIVPMWAADKLLPPPACQLFGIRCVDASEGSTSWALRADPWLCIRRHVQAGVIMTLAHYALTTAVATLCPPGRRVGVIEETMSFLCPVPPDGRDVVARGRVAHQRDLVVALVEVTDGDGNHAALGSQTALITERGHTTRAVEPERVLATVLFTDIVDSTQRAEQLGDARWGELLDEHHGLVRRQLQIFKGREVKTTGDGFLATFDSPARAVQCARAVRDGVARLGIQIRAGLHIGECEVTGADVAGIAVHMASRVLSAAGPGEILVSGTVRDLVAGSGLRFTDHGRHTLKGIEGDWYLFAVEG